MQEPVPGRRRVKEGRRSMQRVMVRVSWLALVMPPACAPADPAGDDDGDDVPAADAAPGQPDASGQPDPDPPDARPPDLAGEPGSACSCDADCAADGTHAGVCVYGICMTVASGQCSSGGSTAECGAGAR